MHIPIDIFICLPSVLLYLCGPDPLAYEVNDACLLTCNEVSALRHAARTPDARVYDIFSLHRWFQIQKSEKKKYFVIPDVLVSHIEVHIWIVDIMLGWIRKVGTKLCDYFTTTHSPSPNITPDPAPGLACPVPRSLSVPAKSQAPMMFTHSPTGPFRPYCRLQLLPSDMYVTRA